MNQSEHITKARELLECFHMWGIGKNDAQAIITFMKEIVTETSNMDWRNAVNKYVNPKTGGKM